MSNDNGVSKQTFQVAAWAIGVCTSLLFGYDAMVTEKIHDTTVDLQKELSDVKELVIRAGNDRWTRTDHLQYSQSLDRYVRETEKHTEQLKRRQEWIYRVMQRHFTEIEAWPE